MLNRRVWVIDCETTGKDPSVDKVVEVAGVLMDGPRIIKTYESLVNPGIPIPPEASAVHHLRDKDVVDAPSLDAAIQPFLEEEHAYVVAHNAKFDKSFVDLGDIPWLCTWKLANRLWPDAPGHSNQVLRYWLGLPDPVAATYPHRALYDAEVTAHLFARALGEAKTEDPYPGMHQVSENPVLLKKCNFGEHTGKLWADVPVSYLKWMVRKSDGWDEDRLFTARTWLERKSGKAA